MVFVFTKHWDCVVIVPHCSPAQGDDEDGWCGGAAGRVGAEEQLASTRNQLYIGHVHATTPICREKLWGRGVGNLCYNISHFHTLRCRVYACSAWSWTVYNQSRRSHTCLSLERPSSSDLACWSVLAKQFFRYCDGRKMPWLARCPSCNVRP